MSLLGFLILPKFWHPTHFLGGGFELFYNSVNFRKMINYYCPEKQMDSFWWDAINYPPVKATFASRSEFIPACLIAHVCGVPWILLWILFKHLTCSFINNELSKISDISVFNRFTFVKKKDTFTCVSCLKSNIFELPLDIRDDIGV